MIMFRSLRNKGTLANIRRHKGTLTQAHRHTKGHTVLGLDAFEKRG